MKQREESRRAYKKKKQLELLGMSGEEEVDCRHRPLAGERRVFEDFKSNS